MMTIAYVFRLRQKNVLIDLVIRVILNDQQVALANNSHLAINKYWSYSSFELLTIFVH